jgi:hypothetical protein
MTTKLTRSETRDERGNRVVSVGAGMETTCDVCGDVLTIDGHKPDATMAEQQEALGWRRVPKDSEHPSPSTTTTARRAWLAPGRRP